jgi:hypothetical protein
MVVRKEVLQTKMSEAVDYYLATCRLEGLSPRTIEWYRQSLMSCTEFLDDPRVSELTVERAREFVGHLGEKEIQPQTIHGYVRSMKAFAFWLEQEEYTRHNVFRRLKQGASGGQSAEEALSGPPMEDTCLFRRVVPSDPRSASPKAITLPQTRERSAQPARGWAGSKLRGDGSTGLPTRPRRRATPARRPWSDPPHRAW